MRQAKAPGPRAALKCDHNKIDEDVPQKGRPGDRERQTQSYDCPGPNALKEWVRASEIGSVAGATALTSIFL
jgi:hypothetical protein